MVKACTKGAYLKPCKLFGIYFQIEIMHYDKKCVSWLSLVRNLNVLINVDGIVN